MSEQVTQKKKSKKKLIFIIVGIVIAFLILCIVGINLLASKLTNMLPKVDVANPVVGDISSSIQTSGTITSGDVTSYTTSVAAAVSEVNIKPGQSVKTGDTLLTFDTSTLEEQYNEAALTARSTQLSNQTTVETSNKTSSDLDKAKKNVTDLKAKISAVEADIKQLQEGGTGEDPNSNLMVALSEKRERLASVLDEIQTMIDANPDTTALATNQDYLNKCNERDTLTASVNNLEKIISIMPDSSSSLTDAITAKSSELADLQSQLAQQESLVTSAEAGILTSTQKEQLNISNQLSNLQVEAAATSLEEGKAGIVADRDGIVTSVEITKGASATPGIALFSIASTDNMKVTVPLSKKDLETVALGQSATITLLNHEYKGEVTYISKIATTSPSGATNIEAEVTILNPDENLVLGLDAKVVIHTASLTNILTIPNLAVNVDNTGSFVYAVENGLVVKKYITTGISDVTNCEVKDGIDESTVVITTITADITEGMPVLPQFPDDSTGTDMKTEPATDTASEES